MRKTRKPLLVAMCMLVAALGVNATMAYLTDSESVTNTFTVGNVDIDLKETKNDFKMVPGEDIAKDPVVTVSAQSEDCWLFAKVVESDNLEDYIDYDMADGWNPLSGEAGVYWREAKAGDSFSVLKGDEVTVLSSVEKADMDALIQKDATTGEPLVDANGKYVLDEDELPELTFTAYAVQKAGFDDSAKTDAENAAAAWAVAIA